MSIENIAELITTLQSIPPDAKLVILDADEGCQLLIQGVKFDKRTDTYEIWSDYNHRVERE